jgi:hypothetical protein
MGNVDSAAAGEDAGSLFGPFIIGLFAMPGSNIESSLGWKSGMGILL